MIQRIFKASALIIGLFFSLWVSGQSFRKVENPTLWQDFTYDMESVFRGVGHAYTRPLHWQGKDFKTAGIVAAGMLGVYTVDNEIHNFLSRNREDVPQFIRDYGWYSGSPQNMYGAQGVLYLTGLFTRNQKLRRAGVLMLSASTATGFFQQVIKSLAGRARPETGLGNHFFKPFGGGAEYRSFPSGHAILTFTAAHSLAKHFENPWVKGGIYTLGLTPGIIRIVESKHWPTDVLFGWAISYFMVNAIDIYLDRRYDEKYNAQGVSQNSKISLSFGGGGIGVGYSF